MNSGITPHFCSDWLRVFCSLEKRKHTPNTQYEGCLHTQSSFKWLQDKKKYKQKDTISSAACSFVWMDWFCSCFLASNKSESTLTKLQPPTFGIICLHAFKWVLVWEGWCKKMAALINLPFYYTLGMCFIFHFIPSQNYFNIRCVCVSEWISLKNRGAFVLPPF